MHILHQIYFQNPIFLWLIILVVPFIFLIKNKKFVLEKIFSDEVAKKLINTQKQFNYKIRMIFFLISIIFMIIAFSRPAINNGEIKVKSSFINIVAAIDISKSMFASDIYPNRFEFAKTKFLQMLKDLKNARVSLIGFSTQTFLISPLTQDFHSLEFLTKNMMVEHLSLKGTDILNTIQSADELFANENVNDKNKILILFSDGGDQKSFDKEIKYAKEHNIVVYVYSIGTLKGGVIKVNNHILKDKNGNIVITKLNTNIKQLALQTGGAYLKYSLSKDDIKLITSDIMKKFKAKEENIDTIKDIKELFMYPLMISIVFLIMSFFSMPRRSYVDFKKSF